MKFIGGVMALVLLAGCSTVSREAEVKALFDAPPQIEMSHAEVEVRLVVGKGGRRYVPFDISGEEMLFLLDTGAVTTIVSTSLAQDLEIETIPVRKGTLYGGGGGSSSSVGIIDEITNGELRILRLPVFFTNLEEWNVRELAAQQTRIDGILGSDLLEYLRASISYTSNTLRIRKPNQPPQPIRANGPLG